MKYIWVAHEIGKHRQALAALGGEWDDEGATFWFTDAQLPALKAYVGKLPEDELVIGDTRTPGLRVQAADKRVEREAAKGGWDYSPAFAAALEERKEALAAWGIANGIPRPRHFGEWQALYDAAKKAGVIG